MKLALVYNPQDNKLLPTSYCQVFRGMFDALIARFESVQHVTDNCSAADIDADLIFFFDPHSSHHIQIDGLKNHSALKMEYWNDPHQQEAHGVYQSTGIEVHKLGRQQRVERAENRDIDFIVSPVKYAFYDYFKPFWTSETINRKLLYFPTAPSFEQIQTPLIERKREVIGTGATWGDRENNGYSFRRWAHEQPQTTVVPHACRDNATPQGNAFGAFLGRYGSALALCGAFPVVKYFEIPLAGCVCFAQYHAEYEELGFKDLEHCIYVNAANFEERINRFLSATDLTHYQKIADAGRELVAGHYTAKHFAEFIYEKCSNHVPIAA